jgi:chaperonin GroES
VVGGGVRLAWAAILGAAEDAIVILGAMRQELRPLFDRVVIKELEPDRVRQSGLVVPPGSHEPPPQHGIVLAVGPGIDWWESAGVSMPVRPGDHVVFPASAGVWVEVEEERLLVCRVGQLLGVLEELEESGEGSLRALEEEDG